MNYEKMSNYKEMRDDANRFPMSHDATPGALHMFFLRYIRLAQR